MSIIIIAIIAALLIVNVAMYTWAFLLYRNWKKCEKSESSFCPSMYCQTPDTDCGHYAYRTDSTGKKVCQSYLLTTTAPKVQASTTTSTGV